MKLFITLGNQLFPLKYLSRFKNDHLFFMAEDYGLCTYEKHHKLKILLFLSSMRSYADNLKKNSFKLTYSRIDSADFKSDYLTKIQKVVKKNKIKVSAGYFNYNPQFIIEKIQDSGFNIVDKRQVGLFRVGFIKQIFPPSMLISFEGILNMLLSSFNIGPSVYIVAKKQCG